MLLWPETARDSQTENFSGASEISNNNNGNRGRPRTY